MPTLRDVLSRLTDERFDFSNGFVTSLSVAVSWFERTHGDIELPLLTAAHVRAVMRAVMDAGNSPRTANNYRMSLRYLWSEAEDMGFDVPPVPDRKKLPRVKELRHVPRAWTREQMQRMLLACREAPTRRGWGPAHWEALASTIYDTSLRIGCLMDSDVSQLDTGLCALAIPAHLQKGRAETFQRLHPTTCRLLVDLPRPAGDTRLFPWPFHEDEIWRQFKRYVLIPAGLPHGRRDLFHKVRRTSYTLVAVAHGIAAASEHAAHRCDMSRYYLDPSFMPRPNPLDALPRIA